ncbi:hypothetical protein [Hymenobacter wooponensis]|uniref:Lipocalin-like domain-containing protein n=1 Tax=Hymenobacter wooponensis TaxID=1525360 RepID=A0A4Z0MBP3_9BACT|nr:hypothetical protein [Hymenobacter wooponensis]TGD77173.1 hypothetical protein EU557_24385 [Hymenobacter wooponensis]
MPRYLHSLLLSLLLLVAAACSTKEVPKPTPSLEGIWVQTRMTEYVPCSNCTTQRFIQDINYPAGVQTLTITPNEYKFNTAQGTNTFSYVRRGDTLLITVPLASGSITSRTSIINLKPSSLHLQQYAPRAGTSAIIDQYFTR